MIRYIFVFCVFMSTALSSTMSLEDLEECASINKKEVEKCNVDTCHKVYNAIKTEEHDLEEAIREGIVHRIYKWKYAMGICESRLMQGKLSHAETEKMFALRRSYAAQYKYYLKRTESWDKDPLNDLVEREIKLYNLAALFIKHGNPGYRVRYIMDCKPW